MRNSNAIVAVSVSLFESVSFCEISADAVILSIGQV